MWPHRRRGEPWCTFPSGLSHPQGITWDGTQYWSSSDVGRRELWTVADVASPANAVNRGSLPSGLGAPRGITWDGTQYVIVDFAPTATCGRWLMWRHLATLSNRGDLPSGLCPTRQGITHDGTQYVGVDNDVDELWTVADVASPGDAVDRGTFPSALTSPQGITHGTAPSWSSSTRLPTNCGHSHPMAPRRPRRLSQTAERHLRSVWPAIRSR